VKIFLLTLVQIPVSLVGLAANGLELLMLLLDLQIRKCKFYLELGFWPQLRAKKIADKPSEKMVEGYVCQTDREQAIEQILSCWEKKSHWTVTNDRRAFEATKWGQQVIRSRPDRHLYSVLYPTRQENLTRIGNVLRAMDAEAFGRVMRNAKRMRCGKH
jgi:hypothetical protein